MHVIAGKAVAFQLALGEDFRRDQQRTIENAATIAAVLAERGFRVVSGGTDNHLMLVDVTSRGVTARRPSTCSTRSGSPSTRTASRSTAAAQHGVRIRVGHAGYDVAWFGEDEMRRSARSSSRRSVADDEAAQRRLAGRGARDRRAVPVAGLPPRDPRRASSRRRSAVGPTVHVDSAPVTFIDRAPQRPGLSSLSSAARSRSVTPHPAHRPPYASRRRTQARQRRPIRGPAVWPVAIGSSSSRYEFTVLNETAGCVRSPINIRAATDRLFAGRRRRRGDRRARRPVDLRARWQLLGQSGWPRCRESLLGSVSASSNNPFGDGVIRFLPSVRVGFTSSGSSG
jgi:hypothetical protein